VRLLDKFPSEAGSFIAAEVRGFKLESYLPDVSGKRMPRHTQFAVAAAFLALEDAGLTFSELRGRSPVVIIGASLMDFGAINKLVDLAIRRGPLNAMPAAVFYAPVSSIGGSVAELIGGTTRSIALHSACCAGIDAVGYSADLIATGAADIAVCGGTESPLFFHPMLELKLAGLAPGNPVCPERQCRPFDLWRTSGAIGEGACVFVLESEQSPRPAYAYIEGYGFASDPADEPGIGLAEAIRFALANAKKHPHQIECINAWGPGHKKVDAAEAAGLKTIFRNHLYSTPAVSIKGAIGNPLGASGAIQVGSAALGLKFGAIPPTVNWQFPDPACPLNLSDRTRFINHSSAVVNAHGLSGTNTCLVLSQ
jgi:3-oxoacyl-(acyl-carrier-protein) synthase